MNDGKLRSIEDLRKIREQAQRDTLLRTASENPNRVVLAVGMATCGIAAGARNTFQALQKAVVEHHLLDVSVVATGCLGLCYAEPIVEVRIPGLPEVRYGPVDPVLAKAIVERHVLRGELIGGAIVGREVRGI